MSAERPLDPQQLVELDAILDRLAAALSRLAEGMGAVREAVAVDSPGRILEATARVEETSAQIARLEADRQRLQGELESALGVSGLSAVIQRSVDLNGEGLRLQARWDEVRLQVTRLQDEGSRTSTLLSTAIQLAIRMRAYLGRLGGTDAPYRPRGAQGAQGAGPVHGGIPS